MPPKMAERIFSGIVNESLTVLTSRYMQVHHKGSINHKWGLMFNKIFFKYFQHFLKKNYVILTKMTHIFICIWIETYLLVDK